MTLITHLKNCLMIIDHKKKIIFIRPTKVGSSSIMKAIISQYKSKLIRSSSYLCSDEFLAVTPAFNNNYFPITEHDYKNYVHKDFENPHVLPKRIMEIVGEDNFNSYLKFSVVRNPYTWLLSKFLFGQEKILNNLKNKNFYSIKNNFINTPLPLIRSFIPRNKMIFKFWIRKMDKEVLDKFFYIDNKEIIDRYLKFENLQDDFMVFAEEVGLKNKNLMHENKIFNAPEKEKLFNQYYDTDSISLVSKKFSGLIKKFEYEVPYQ